MECDILRKPICVCDSDHKSPPSLSISLINFPKHVSSFKIPEIRCCCCICKPLQDDSKKNDIHDLGFALRKLEVMKCQIKKWRDEKLQLESEIRALKHALQSRGKYKSNYSSLNPLIIEYGNKNVKSKLNEVEREEKLLNLQNILVPESHGNSCRGIQMLNAKIRALRTLSGYEQQRHKKTLPESKSKENEREIVPADINSLEVVSRADNGGIDTKIDRHEKILEGKKVTDDITENHILKKKNSEVIHLKDELTTYFENLKKSYQSLMTEINSYVEELKKRDDKLIELLNQSRPIFFDGLRMSSFVDQIKMVESQLHDANIMRDKLLNELYRILEQKLTNEKLLKGTYEKSKNEKNGNNEISERELDINPIFDLKNKVNNLEKDESLTELNLETLKNDENLNTLLDQRRQNVEELQRLEEYLQKSNEYKKLPQERIEWNEKFNHLREKLFKNEEDLKQVNNRLVQEENEMKALTTNISDSKKQLKLFELKITKLETLNNEIHNKLLNVIEILENYKKQLSTEFESTKFMHKELNGMKSELNNLLDKLNSMQKNYNDLKIKQDSLNKLLSNIQEVTEVRTTNDNIGEKSFHLLSAASSTPIALKSKDENSKNNIISLEESIEFCKFGISQLNRKIKTLDALFDNTEKLRLYKDEFECLQNELSTSRSDEQSLNQLDKQLSNKNLDEKMDLTKINSLIEENQIIKNKLKEYESINKKLSNDLNKTEQGHADLSEKIHSLLNNVVGSGSFIEELGYGYNQVKETLSTAKKDINSLRKKSERIEHDTVALRNHNESLKAEILVFNKQLNENNNHMKSMNKILELLKMKLHDKQTHSDDLQSNFHDYKSKIKSLMTEFYILKKEIENLKKYHDIKEVKLNNTKIAEDGLFTVKNELTELTQKWHELISSIDYLKKQTEDSKNCNLILNNQLERVKSIINNLRMENDLNFKTKKLDVKFETVQTNNEEQKKLNYELAKRSLGADEEYDEPKKEVTRSPAEFSKKTKDISPKSSLQDELEIFRSNNVNLEETIETSMVDNNHLREEFAKIQNDMSTLEVKSNKSLMVNDELIDKVKLIIHEDASFNKKVDWLHHYDNVDIESRHEEELLIHDSLPTETQIFELGSKDINDLTDNSMINNTNVNKLLNEVELDDKDTFDVEVADQSFDNVKIQQETLKKLQKRNIVSHNNSEIIKTDLQMRQNENPNSNKINPRTNESIIGMKTEDNVYFTSNKVESKQHLQGNISLKENNDVPNSGQRHVKTERQKSLRKQNHEILSTSLKKFDHESSIKNYSVDDENVFDEFHQFIYKNMKKHFEGLSCINDIILDMNNQKSQKESKTMLLNNDDLTVFDISNPLLKKIAQLSVDILNNITYIIRNLTEVNEMLKNYLKENLQLKMTLLKVNEKMLILLISAIEELIFKRDTVLGIPTSLRENMLKSKEWLEPLTLTHLADIHEKICLMASKVVTEDEDLTSFTLNKIYSSSKCLNKCDRECEIMSPRVTALQRKIFELQKQTCDKVLDIQKAIEHRKTGLDEISKIIKCERQRNYTSYPIDNASSLTPNICVTKCAEKEKFIQIIQWEKQ